MYLKFKSIYSRKTVKDIFKYSSILYILA
ncbi:uncharacterized protein METZ01_LOCUS346660, partial [marine metagenome]